MNNREHDSYYYILGIQPGASADEIKSAFRRLTEQHHVDNDQSLDAEMKYMEIQTAYRALLNLSAGKTSFETNYTQQTEQAGSQNQPNQQNQQAGNQQKNTSSEEVPWYVKDIRDWETEHTAYRSTPRIPFSVDGLPSILKASFNELHYHIFKAALIAAFLSCFSNGSEPVRHWNFIIMPYVNLLLLFYPISFIFLLLFRYYLISSAWPALKQVLAAGIYGAVLMFIIPRLYTIDGFFSGSPGSLNANTLHVIWTGLLSSIAAWFIIANPIPPITSTQHDL